MWLERAVEENELLESLKLKRFDLCWKVQTKVGKFSMQY